jgi:hypothetical protein
VRFCVAHSRFSTPLCKERVFAAVSDNHIDVIGSGAHSSLRALEFREGFKLRYLDRIIVCRQRLVDAERGTASV